MRRFQLHRKEDESGVSGTGIVAEGVEFENGKCAVSWCSQYSSVAVYDSISVVSRIHGHGGKTEIVWLDGPDARNVDAEETSNIVIQAIEEAVAEYRRTRPAHAFHPPGEPRFGGPCK